MDETDPTLWQKQTTVPTYWGNALPTDDVLALQTGGLVLLQDGDQIGLNGY